ncbi:unnamed protein product [Penicillium pancosmium]
MSPALETSKYEIHSFDAKRLLTMSSSLETIGHGVPNGHFSSLSSAARASGLSNHAARTKWTFNAAKVDLKMMQSLSDELQTPRADNASISPKFADDTPGTRNTGTSPQNAKQTFGNSSRVPMAKLTSPMPAKFPDSAIHAPETSASILDPTPKNQPQGPGDKFDIMKSIPTHESPDPTNSTGCLIPNQFDFIFLDRMLLQPEIHTAYMDAVPRFLDSLESTVRNMEDTAFPLQTFMIQQQLVAGIPPEKVEPMFSETSSNANANHYQCREMIVEEGEPDVRITSPRYPGRPRYKGTPPHLSDRVLASILTGPRPVGERDGLSVLEGGAADDFETEDCDRTEDFHSIDDLDAVDGLNGLNGLEDLTEHEDLNDIEDLNSIANLPDIDNLSTMKDHNRTEDLNETEKDNDIEMGNIDTSNDLESLFKDDG